jgi:O-antigen ligase
MDSTGVSGMAARPAFRPRSLRADDERQVSVWERALMWGVLLLLIWAPIPLGSNREWSSALLMVLVFALLAGWALLALRDSRVLPPARLFRVGLLLFAFLLLAQLWVSVQWLAGISDAPANSARQLWLGLAYSGLFLLVIALFHRRSRLSGLLVALVISGTLQAFYGAFMALSGLEWAVGFVKEGYRGTATGTFINRNHLAGYLEMTLALGIGLMLALRDGKALNWRNLVELLAGPKARLRLALIVMVIALVMTHSRGGNIGFFTALVVVGSVFVLRFPQNRLRNTFILASIILIDVIVISQYFGLDRLRERLVGTEVAVTLERLEPGDVQETREASGELREDWRLVVDMNDLRGAIFTNAIPIALERPWLGYGAGAFETIFVSRGDPGARGRIDHAHNDYLQFWIEFGGIGLLPLGFFLLGVSVLALRALLHRESVYRSGVGFGASMGILAILIHSWSDFNLQIPANAATFVVLCAIAVLAWGHDGERRRAENRF